MQCCADVQLTIPDSCAYISWSCVTFCWKAVVCDQVHICCVSDQLPPPIHTQYWRPHYYTRITVASLPLAQANNLICFLYDRLANLQKQELEGLAHVKSVHVSWGLTGDYSRPDRPYFNCQSMFWPTSSFWALLCFLFSIRFGLIDYQGAEMLGYISETPDK